MIAMFLPELVYITHNVHTCTEMLETVGSSVTDILLFQMTGVQRVQI